MSDRKFYLNIKNLILLSYNGSSQDTNNEPNIINGTTKTTIHMKPKIKKRMHYEFLKELKKFGVDINDPLLEGTISKPKRNNSTRNKSKTKNENKKKKSKSKANKNKISKNDGSKNSHSSNDSPESSSDLSKIVNNLKDLKLNIPTLQIREIENKKELTSPISNVFTIKPSLETIIESPKLDSERTITATYDSPKSKESIKISNTKSIDKRQQKNSNSQKKTKSKNKSKKSKLTPKERDKLRRQKQASRQKDYRKRKKLEDDLIGRNNSNNNDNINNINIFKNEIFERDNDNLIKINETNNGISNINSKKEARFPNDNFKRNDKSIKAKLTAEEKGQKEQQNLGIN